MLSSTDNHPFHLRSHWPSRLFCALVRVGSDLPMMRDPPRARRQGRPQRGPRARIGRPRQQVHTHRVHLVLGFQDCHAVLWLCVPVNVRTRLRGGLLSSLVTSWTSCKLDPFLFDWLLSLHSRAHFRDGNDRRSTGGRGGRDRDGSKDGGYKSRGRAEPA